MSAATDYKHIEVSQQDGVDIISLKDRNMLEETSIVRMRDEIIDVLNKNDRRSIILDFANVRHMSSAALGILLTIHNRIRDEHRTPGKLVLANVATGFYETLAITRLNNLFTVAGTIDDAMKTITGGRGQG